MSANIGQMHSTVDPHHGKGYSLGIRDLYVYTAVCSDGQYS